LKWASYDNLMEHEILYFFFQIFDTISQRCKVAANDGFLMGASFDRDPYVWSNGLLIAVTKVITRS